MATTREDLSRAFALHRRGEWGQAARVCERILSRDPQQSEAWHLAGVIAHQIGRHNDAVQSISQAIRIDPSNAEYWNNLAAVCLALGNHESAIECCANAIRQRPDFAEAHNHYGTALRLAGRVEQAVSSYERALAIRPDSAPFHANLAATFQELGDFDRALAHYHEALRLNPDDAGTYFNLSQWVQGGKYSFTAEQLAHIRRLLDAGNLPARSAGQLCFAVARTLELRGECAEAFEYLSRGNELRRELLAQNQVRFDPAGHALWIDRLIATFDRGHFAEASRHAVATELPLFIVGMPRSGTTLVEQILVSHPAVASVGESDAIPRLVRALEPPGGADGSYPEAVVAADAGELCRMADAHVADLRGRAPAALRVADKLPGNILHLGFIATLFSGARVIHCRRHPLDVCISCFAQNFQADELAAYCSSLDALAAYYLGYERITEHWRAVLPLPVMEIQYEELVASPDRVIPQLIAFCGLEWDERCLEFHRTNRAVRTASSLQVRQPIYDTSIGRWRRYAPQLELLRRALGSIVTD